MYTPHAVSIRNVRKWAFNIKKGVFKCAVVIRDNMKPDNEHVSETTINHSLLAFFYFL